jgi:hypothetical protein
MNGQAYYKHSSGYSYEGLFENGVPTKGPRKLVISILNNIETNDKFKLLEGNQLFKAKVKVVNEEGEVFIGIYLMHILFKIIINNKIVFVY